MTLIDSIRAAGMTPPQHIAPGRFVRFPGHGKKKGNTAGWCKVITPTLAIYGDWSTGLSDTWIDESQVDNRESQRLIAQAQREAREMRRRDEIRQRQAAETAQETIKLATYATHPYLKSKGFPDEMGLIKDGKLLIPMRDVARYRSVLSVQEISDDGTKRFLPGSRTKGAVYRLGVLKPLHIVLCEGYATGLSLHAACRQLSASCAVIVCFSIGNLVAVARHYPGAAVAADNDLSEAGSRGAEQTGLKWTMPYEVGTDFNDLHQSMGLHVIVERMQELLMP